MPSVIPPWINRSSEVAEAPAAAYSLEVPASVR